jgi:cellulase
MVMSPRSLLMVFCEFFAEAIWIAQLMKDSYEGYSPEYQYITPAPITVGWLTPEDLSNGFVDPSLYATPDIVCHEGATNAQIAAPVIGGGIVEFQWTPWPTSHHGPMVTYLGNCNGPCETVDKTTLEWFKIDEVGLIDPTVVDGYWGSDILIANNNSWQVVIPSTIATGNYFVRHETIALHSASTVGGAQVYPFCLNLAITSSGSDNPAGINAETIYNENSPSLVYDIYVAPPLPAYTPPGPALYSGVVTTLSQTLPAAPTASASGVYTVS